MNSVLSAIVARVVAQVSSLPSGNIGPPPLPDTATYPYVTALEIIDNELQTLTGDSHLAYPAIQVNCWSPDYEESYQMRESVKSALIDYAGTSSGRVVQGIQYIGGHYLYDPARRIHQHVARFKVWVEN